MGLAKRRRGGQTYPEQSNDEQAVSESSLNKLVGAAEVYDLKVNTIRTDRFIIKFTASHFQTNNNENGLLFLFMFFAQNFPGSRTPKHTYM